MKPKTKKKIVTKERRRKIWNTRKYEKKCDSFRNMKKGGIGKERIKDDGY